MNIFPTTDRIAVLPLTEQEESSGLQIVRDNKNTEMQFGEVVAAGPDSPIREGQRVLFNPSAGTLMRRLKDNGQWEDVRIMHSDAIQCVIDA